MPVASSATSRMAPPEQRRTVSPQRFYTPPGLLQGATPVGAVPGTYGMVAERGHAVREQRCDVSNVVIVDSVVAGVGASTLAAILARELNERGLKCVLVDADLQGGGLDVLLGMENEDGSRLGAISAPLGIIDGKALLRELPVWDGVPLLSCDPWKTENPQSWEVQACIRALSQVRSVVIVDVGQWSGLRDLTELRQAIRITVVEMTVLGLARTKANMQLQRNPSDPIGEHDVATQEREFLVGMQPRGTIRDHGVTATKEAAEYLDCDIAAVITTDAKLCSELLEGLGLRKPNRANAIADASTVEGVRVHAVIAPLVPQGAAISIRLPDAVAPNLESLAKNGMFPSEWMPLLEGFVERKASVLVTGGTGAGKTTLLKAMLMRCAPGERIITVEEVRELGMLDHDNRVSLVTRDANMEGKGAIGLSQLICATLRMRPDRIVVGECRGGEIVDLLRALNSGHRGGMTTLHANQVAAVPSRLVALGLLAGLSPQATAALAQDAFDVVLHVSRVGGRRRITQIGRLEFAEGKLRGNLLSGWNGSRMLASRQWSDFVRAWSR